MLVSRTLKWATFILGGLIAVYVLVYFTWESAKVVNYYNSGTAGTDIRQEADSSLIIVNLDSEDFIAFNTPSVRDTLISINDSTATLSRWNETFYSPLEPGRVVPLKYRHNGQVFRTKIKTHPPRKSDLLQVLLINILRFLVAVSFIIVGSWAYFQRSDSGGVRALTLFSYSMVLFLVQAVSVLSARYSSFDIPLHSLFSNFFGYLIPYFAGFWLNLQLLFPRPHKFIREHPVLAYALCYAPATLFHILYDFFGFSAQAPVLIIISVQVTAGFLFLGYSYNRGTDSLERRQMRLVLMGSGFGLSSLFIVLLMAVLFNDWLSTWGGAGFLITFCFFALLFSPLSFAYAFQRYRLFEVEAKLRRGTRYVIATSVLLGVLLGLIYIVGELLISKLGIISRTPTLIVAMGLALGFAPAFKALRIQVDQRFYPEKRRLKETIRDILQRMLTIPDCKSLWIEVENSLRAAVQLEALYPVIREKEGTRFILERDNEETTPFNLDEGLAMKAAMEKRPILVDEAIASEKSGLSLEEEAWLIRRNIAVMLPMTVRNELTGFLALGYKMGREEYAADEILILVSMAQQLALASENIRLLEENIEKKRMEKELHIARDIQQGFLPTILPETKGLEITAGSKFCLEVAGDYYDVLTRKNGQTVLAVGDVSGKGAGAALLMANLQASLRTAIGISTHLGDIVARINELIHRNTPPEQYITFFVGVFNHDDKTLTYVNAGHNFPVVLRENGDMIVMEKGGLILGVLPDAEYEQDTIQLQSNDLLVMYTDGVTEAMNDQEEEYGEERLVVFAREYFDRSIDEIRPALEKEVMDFTNGMPLADDFTLIFARVT